MAMNVNTNVSAMTAQRYLNQAAEGQQKINGAFVLGL